MVCNAAQSKRHLSNGFAEGPSRRGGGEWRTEGPVAFRTAPFIVRSTFCPEIVIELFAEILLEVDQNASSSSAQLTIILSCKMGAVWWETRWLLTALHDEGFPLWFHHNPLPIMRILQPLMRANWTIICLIITHFYYYMFAIIGDKKAKLIAV